MNMVNRIFISLIIVVFAMWGSITIYDRIMEQRSEFFYGVDLDEGDPIDLPENVMLYLTSTNLGETIFVANIGAFKVNADAPPPWEGYKISIEATREVEGYDGLQTAYSPYFSRWFRKDQISEKLWLKSVEEVVSFDAECRLATFHLGFTNVTCVLPDGF